MSRAGKLVKLISGKLIAFRKKSIAVHITRIRLLRAFEFELFQHDFHNLPSLL